jgi:hypothetical protein
MLVGLQLLSQKALASALALATRWPVGFRSAMVPNAPALTIREYEFAAMGRGQMMAQMNQRMIKRMSLCDLAYMIL